MSFWCKVGELSANYLCIKCYVISWLLLPLVLTKASEQKSHEALLLLFVSSDEKASIALGKLTLTTYVLLWHSLLKLYGLESLWRYDIPLATRPIGGTHMARTPPTLQPHLEEHILLTSLSPSVHKLHLGSSMFFFVSCDQKIWLWIVTTALKDSIRRRKMDVEEGLCQEAGIPLVRRCSLQKPRAMICHVIPSWINRARAVAPHNHPVAKLMAKFQARPDSSRSWRWSLG